MRRGFGRSPADKWDYFPAPWRKAAFAAQMEITEKLFPRTLAQGIQRLLIKYRIGIAVKNSR